MQGAFSPNDQMRPLTPRPASAVRMRCTTLPRAASIQRRIHCNVSPVPAAHKAETASVQQALAPTLSTMAFAKDVTDHLYEIDIDVL
jgi:hypothetical protein